MGHDTLHIETRRKPWVPALFGLIIFASLYLFFTKAHPLYILDLDDWFYLYYSRDALPSALEMNPIKVLPETWMPMVSYLSAYLIYPITDDYLQALSVGYAIVLSGMITVYVLAVMAVLDRRFEIKSQVTLGLLGCAFLLSHFVPFILQKDGNTHLFYAQNVTCVFNYTLPALMNLVLLAYFLDQNQQWTPHSPAKFGMILLGLYLAIFSSLFHSIVLMSLFGIQLLFALLSGIWNNIRSKRKWICWPFLWNYAKLHSPKLLALAVWFLSMLFQLGGRAEDISGPFRLMDILYAFQELLVWGINPQLRTGMAIINLAALAVAAYRFFRYRESKFLVWQAELLGCIGLIVVYLILVTGKLHSSYFTRPDVVINWMSILLLMSVSSLAYFLKLCPKAAALVPILVYILLFGTVFSDITYAEYNVSQLAPSVVKAVGDDIVAQVEEAEAQGLDEVEVYVPASLATGWPLDTTLSNSRISRPLWYHAVTDDRVFVTVVPSPEKDAQFHLD